MCHRLSGPSTYGLQGQCVGDEHPTYNSGNGPFSFTLSTVAEVVLYLFILNALSPTE